MNAITNPRDWNGATPPDYPEVVRWRMSKLAQMRTGIASGLTSREGIHEYYKTRPVEFIMHWCVTFDPRGAMDPDASPVMPFIPFAKQREMIEFLYALVLEQAPGLIEKSRDMGATWVAVAFSVWLWLFHPGAAVGWGSRVAPLVDQLGDPKSIFEKVRQTILWLPRDIFWPRGFSERYMSLMRVINPENGASIVGEVGDNIGRGGRTLIYFKDESSHYEHPEMIEAALQANTNVQVDISSVNGIGNVFYRRRKNGVEWSPGQPLRRDKANVLVMDWSDNPMKTREWYDAEEARFEGDGLSHIFASEVKRDYTAAVTGVIVPAKWFEAVIDAHLVIPGMEEGKWHAAIDPADEGEDKHAAGVRKGVVLKFADHWGEGDTGTCTRKCIGIFRENVPEAAGRLEIQYDAPGVGAGVKSEANRLKNLPDGDPEKLPKWLLFVPWNGGGFDGSATLHPDEKVTQDDSKAAGLMDQNALTNKDMFANVKAQAWWGMRRRAEKTFNAVAAVKAGLPCPYPAEELMSVDTASIKKALGDESRAKRVIDQLKEEMSQPVRKQNIVSTKLTIDKKPPGTKSPNLADQTVMLFFPMPPIGYDLAAAL